MVTKAVSDAVAARGGIDPTAIVIGAGVPTQATIPMNDAVSGNTGGAHEAHRLANHRAWSLADLARLAQGRTATTARWTRALDLCSEAGPGVWLSSSEIARRSGMGINEWRDAPRKITRHLNKHYPDVPVNESGDHFWPLAVGGGGIPDNGGEVWWAITIDQKRRWDEVRGH